MYSGVMIMLRATTGEGRDLPTTVGVHQLSPLVPCLFAPIMGLKREMQNDVSWCVLFADGIVLID